MQSESLSSLQLSDDKGDEKTLECYKLIYKILKVNNSNYCVLALVE